MESTAAARLMQRSARACCGFRSDVGGSVSASLGCSYRIRGQMMPNRLSLEGVPKEVTKVDDS